jgi:hypothetical protein
MTPRVTHLRNREVGRSVERELWARAAGRCQFSGCNRVLYRSEVTQERINASQRAHIYSFASGGPRGHGPLPADATAINHIDNLLLVCYACHQKIDNAEERYTAELLRQWKKEHEARTELVTGIHPNKRSHVVLYSAPIGEVAAQTWAREAMEAMFPDWYPASPEPMHLTMKWEGKERDAEFWRVEEANLVRSFCRQVAPKLGPDCHFSLFGIAPMPLLAKLGALITDQVAAEVYQRHREPQTWRWLPADTSIEFRAHRPADTTGIPALVVSLSDRVSPERITNVLGTESSVWELTIDQPGNDFLRSPDQLGAYRRALRHLVDDIGVAHGKQVPIHVFPAMPVACAIDLGRIRMPKADAPWLIYDQTPVAGRFVLALTLGESNG